VRHPFNRLTDPRGLTDFLQEVDRLSAKTRLFIQLIGVRAQPRRRRPLNGSSTKRDKATERDLTTDRAEASKTLDLNRSKPARNADHLPISPAGSVFLTKMQQSAGETPNAKVQPHFMLES
jgi:hypothetical protein